MSGMFVRSGTMVPVGAVCAVAFELHNGGAPIRATAEVLWTRERDKGPDRPKGIGIRFVDLDLDSKYAISRLVEQYIRLGELPFHLTGVGGASAASRGRMPLWITLAFLIGLTLGSLGSLWMIKSPNDKVIETEITANSPRAFATRPTMDTVPSAPAPAGPDLALPVSADEDRFSAIASSVAAWARVWSNKDVAGYLASYSERFQPTSGLPLATWQAQRRERLSRPGFIKVEISSLEVDTIAPDRAIARFEQAFASPGYQDRVAKLLELVWEEQAWRVVREETVRQLADPEIRPSSESAGRSASQP